MDLQVRFNYHKPDENRAKRHETVRDILLASAEVIHSVTPEGREQSLALTKLEEAMFWANAAIAREGK